MDGARGGQWLAPFKGGVGMLDLDDRGNVLTGQLYIAYSGTPVAICSQIVLTSRATEHDLTLRLARVDSRNGELLTDERLAELGLGEFAKSASVNLRFEAGQITVRWRTDTGLSGEMAVPDSGATRASDYRGDPTISTWAAFKESGPDLAGCIFRGQGFPWRMRTAFHRTGRRDLSRYVNEDIPFVHRRLMGRTKHFFDLRDEHQYAAFLNLIQHHGYPTPLLDWTESPFVAAFFAFKRRRAPEEDQEAPVRVIAFDARAWGSDFSQLNRITVAGPHLSLLAPFAIENPRLQPQQGLSTVTNIEDVEQYIATKEASQGKQYLRVFDLPYSERDVALRDLSMMGLTAGTLFPGLDGVCEDLRSQAFGF